MASAAYAIGSDSHGTGAQRAYALYLEWAELIQLALWLFNR